MFFKETTHLKKVSCYPWLIACQLIWCHSNEANCYIIWLHHLRGHYALIKLFRVFSYNPSLENGHYNSDFKWESFKKTHARLLVSEWHLQIWMCVFAAVAKGIERAAKGSRKVWIPLFINIYVIVFMLGLGSFPSRIATGSMLGTVYCIYTTLWQIYV